MRINAFIARAGIASRRAADELIKGGKVTINGRIAQLNDQAGDNDNISVNGKKITSQRLCYVLLYKPAGYVTTLSDPEGRKKVTDLVDLPERLVPVGRLDFNTTGVLLLTNDGQLAHKLMHPSHAVDKVYEAEVKGQVTGQKLNMLSNGVKLEVGLTAPAKARKIADNKIELTIHEGRNHQVKRMLAVVDLPVVKLHRSHYASLDLDGLTPGSWRKLSASEIKNLL